MKNFIHTSFHFLMTLVFAGCATSRIVVKSEPSESEVYVRAAGSEEKKSIGKTPITMSFSELKEATKIDPASGEFFELVVEKSDFQPERFLIPAARMGHAETIVLAKLKSSEGEGKTVHRLLQHLFNAQKLANDREYERAQLELDKAFAIDAKFTRGMSLRGSIFFVQQKYEESLKWFQRALDTDPQFEDAVKMISQIKSIMNGPARGTSSEGNP